MFANNIAFRSFHAVEIMGSVTTICADKTGTLTTTRLSVAQSYIGGKSKCLETILKKIEAHE